jgi:hypothetical protein
MFLISRVSDDSLLEVTSYKDVEMVQIVKIVHMWLKRLF